MRRPGAAGPMTSTRCEPHNALMAATPRARAFELVNGFRASALVGVAAELRLPDHLQEKPLTADELAARTSTLPDPMRRLLRGLAALGVVEELDGGEFSLTDVGRQFQDGEGSMRAPAIALPKQSGPSFTEIAHSLETGRPGYDKVHGQSRWDHLSGDPQAIAEFQAFMTASSERVVPALLEAFDFSGAHTVIDVGGGHGGLLAGVLAAHPEVQGVIFDLQSVLDTADSHLARKGVAERCRLVEGSFFEEVPGGGDAYLLKFILHDWLDEECARILERCRAAMKPGSSLLVLERILPERATPENLGSFMADMEMMVAVGGRERTLSEFERLLNGAQLTLESTAHLGGEIHLLVARPS